MHKTLLVMTATYSAFVIILVYLVILFRGTCLKDNTVPTIFSFSKGEKNLRGRKPVSMNVEVSDSAAAVANVIEEVAYVDSGSSASSSAVDQSKVTMHEDTPEHAVVASDVVHDDVALTVTACDDVCGCSVETNYQSVNQADAAADHSYVMVRATSYDSNVKPSGSLGDHSYIVSQSPRTLKGRPEKQRTN